MTLASEELDVLVADHGVDALLLRRPDQRPLLVLQPFMSFGAAVKAVSAVQPNMPTDDVRRLVRTHLPRAVDLDEMLLPVEGITPERPGRVFGWLTWLATITAIIAMLMLVAGFFFIHVNARNQLRMLDPMQQRILPGIHMAQAHEEGVPPKRHPSMLVTP